MTEIKVIVTIKTEDPLETYRAVHKYLQETLEKEFLQDWYREEIVSIETDHDGKED